VWSCSIVVVEESNTVVGLILLYGQLYNILQRVYHECGVICFLVQLPEIEAKMKETNHVILTPLVSLDTPGKTTVEVVILADPVR